MFGWEFPPNNRGGLGTACYGLTKALSKKGVNIKLVLPKKNPDHDHLTIITADDVDIGSLDIKFVDSSLVPYVSVEEYSMQYSNNNPELELYGRDLINEVKRYAKKAKIIANSEDFDVIHCHDWMTYKAGIAAKKASGKPLVVHIHATDFDRTGGNPNQLVYDIEKQGMHHADKVIAVSNYTKNMVVKKYGIPSSKVHVVHNGVEMGNMESPMFKTKDKIVLFLGRLTLQKGPEYFIESAKKVLDMMPDVKFVVAGSGEMYGKMIDKAADLGIAKNVLFTGHLKGDDVDKAYQMADLYVMPSVSEPFGITPLEALRNNTPVLISKTSGVSEVLTNALKVDFWDIDEMTNKIVSVLHYDNLNSCLVEHGFTDVQKITWDNAAEKCVNLYKGVVS